MHHQGILRLKQLGARLDCVKIPHRIACRQHRRVGIRPELKVRPQGAAEKRKVSDLDRLVFQQTNIAASRCGSKLVEHSRNRMIIVGTKDNAPGQRK